ncbi:MAG: 3-deoxy-D-manno-octulosonic acid transferase [Bacteroidales bacterium]|nr:3-deoxy-D-manno-octulosonic acid transferase [Bacteroidales bacterium]
MYSFLISLYALFIRAAAFAGNTKARQLAEGQKKIWTQLTAKLIPGERRIWIHCASVGEFEQGRPLIEELREKYPRFKIALTFFSPSGYELRKNYSGVDDVFYLPFDTRKNACRFVEMLLPEKVFFVKYEFWRNYLRETRRRHIPLYLISANFRKGQLFFKWYGGWYRKLLKNFAHFFVQNEHSRELLAHYGFNNVTVTGDTRFDRVCKIADEAKRLPVVEQFVQNERCLVAGSTWPADTDMLLRYIRSGKHRLKWIIAPHELHDEQIEKLMADVAAGSAMKALRFSKAKDSGVEEYDVLIIDNIGMLASLYRYGTVAYIGGGFGKGIHNILEAAAYGIPVLFGPNYGKFQEAVNLSALGGAFSVRDAVEFARLLDGLLDDPAKLLSSGTLAGRFVDSGKGATSKVLQLTMN